jgi:hypothetical protein
MMGPMHDMMQSVHEVAEEARRTDDLFVGFLLGDNVRETQHAGQTLEMIRTKVGCDRSGVVVIARKRRPRPGRRTG